MVCFSESHDPTSAGEDVYMFAEVLSTGVIILALFELYEGSLQRSYTLHSFCDHVIINVFEMVYDDLEQLAIQSVAAAALDELCSQIAVTILDEVYAQYYETVMRSSPDLAGASLGELS